jgi:hypothetical protein
MNTIHLGEITHRWALTLDRCPRTSDAALLLAMALVAIHPFSDANGRAGRFTYTWLRERWGLGLQWLGEGADGELLRTGIGISSTEYLMATFMITLMEGHNVVAPGSSGHDDATVDVMMKEALERSLDDIASQHPNILNAESFKSLRNHLAADNHIVDMSPRFESLKSLIF